MSKVKSRDDNKLFACLRMRGLSMTKDEFWNLDTREINDLIEATPFTKEEIDRIWVREYAPFEVH